MPTTQTATTITMPQLGESVTEGTIGSWLKEVGDRVDRFDPLVEVETDKVNTEIPSPIAGVLVEILVEPESTVPVGAVLCRIDESGDEPSAISDQPSHELAAPALPEAREGGGEARAETVTIAFPERRRGEVEDEMELLRSRSSPVVRRIAEEHGIALADVAGSGVGGRVTKRDIVAHVETMHERVAAAPALSRPVPHEGELRERPAVAAQVAPASSGTRRPVQLMPGDEVVPVTPMRRSIAEHMVVSERTAPHATVVMEVDMTGVVAARAAAKEEFKRREGIDLTYLPFAIKATTLALRDHPRLNAVWDEERIVHRGAINIGVAVALDDGLIVPVIKHADRLSVAGLMHAVADLAAKAQAGTLAPDEVAGGTFTVNNPGTFGSLVSTPILVQPQAAILSTEAIVKRPVVIDDMIAIRSMMNLSLTIDHRVLDGLQAARFLQQVKRWLEQVDAELAIY